MRPAAKPNGFAAGRISFVARRTSIESYVVERTTDSQAATSWTQAGVSPRSSLILEGLDSGKRYHFRVAAVTLNGQSPWSNHAVKVAP